MADEFLAEYAKFIQTRLVARDGKPFPNASLAHAEMIVDAMFRNASERIRILTGELNARVYGTSAVLDSASQFLANSDHRLEVVFEGDFDDSEARRHPLLMTVGRGENVKLYRLDPSQRSKVTSHFMIMDSDSYRFEGDKTKPSAIAAFNDEEFTRRLSFIFDALRDRASREFRIFT